MSEPGNQIPQGQTLAELGEFGLIAALQRRLPQGQDVEVGPGDDAAVLVAADGKVVVSTDVLVDTVHFRTDWSSAHDVGRRAAAASLIDVAAMGARPTALVVALAAPQTMEVAWALRLADGLRDEAARVGASVVGGDLSSSDRLTIAVTALGDLEGRSALTRGGARPGDVVAISGRLGWAAAGLAVLSRGFRSPRVLVEAFRCPEPTYEAGPQAANAGAHAMCDVSDGLIADLGHVASASEVAINVHSDAFTIPEPIAAVAAAYGTDALEWVLTGGEDHALLATFPRDANLPETFTIIGEVISGSGVLVDGVERADAGGHRHFEAEV